VGALQLNERWSIATTVRLASGFPYTAPRGVRVASIDDSGDGDLDGNTEELVPRRDAAGLLVYAPDLGTSADLGNARLPMFARVDLRVTWRPRGTAGRWELYAEVLNLLNRENAPGLDPRLAYDPTSDHPRVVETPIGSIPFLPTIGVRFRF
jgi:outer membrane receptor protein involved in Fe transport